MTIQTINFFYFLCGMGAGGLIDWFLIRNQIEKAVNKKNLQIAHLEGEKNSEENIKSTIRNIASEATKPILDDLTTRESDLKVRENNFEIKKEREETREQYETAVRSLNAEKKLEDIIKQMGFIEPQMVEFRKNQDGIKGVPDATLKFPYGKKLMCDAKAPLEYFDEYFLAGKSGNRDKMNEIKKKIAKAIKGHIDDLYKSAYFNADNSLPYVILFLPSERVIQIVRELGSEFSNKEIDAYARDRNIVITSPSTFYPAVENIQAMWQEFKNTQNTNQVLTVINKAFDKMRIIAGKLSSFNKSFNVTVKNANELNSSLANALGKAAREAKSLSYDDENVIKIIDEEKQIHLNEIDVIKEKNK